MKIAGLAIEAPKEREVPIPRINDKGEEEFIVFKIKPILVFDEFDKQFPMPTPKKKKVKGITQVDSKDPKYVAEVNAWSKLRITWLILQSLSPTAIEWDTVTDDPTTWENYHKELKDSGFSAAEVEHIESEIIRLCGMSSSNLSEARNRFLASKRVKGAKA